jgi:tetratricopeptide (TPR) repeat protein
MIFSCSALLALATTYHSCVSPSSREAIDKRLVNGTERFAARYARHGSWDTAAELYLHVHSRKPLSSRIFRKLATCYQQLGDREKFDLYNTKALLLDRLFYEEFPDDISLNLSLARTYEQRDDPDNAKYHREKALRSALDRANQSPNSASAAYWLGLTYWAIGDRPAAEARLQEASALEPHSVKYRNALSWCRRTPRERT